MTNHDVPGNRQPASPRTLEVEQARDEGLLIMSFWSRYSQDGAGGFVSQLNRDGKPYNFDSRHLVAASRFVVNFSLSSLVYDRAKYLALAQEAFDSLKLTFTDTVNGGYYWIVRRELKSDRRKFAYGHGFVTLAAACAMKAGVLGARELLAEVTAIADRHFFAGGALAWNSSDEDWSSISRYRGQNANMHYCEAFIAAYEATRDDSYLDRAFAIASSLIREPASQGNAIFENYDENWKIISDAAWRHAGNSMESEWPIIPGHQAEWAKLLGLLARHRPEAWILPAAKNLYQFTWAHGWDTTDGGLFKALDSQGAVSDFAKCYWSPPEVLGAAAVLEALTGAPEYSLDRARVWQYVSQQMRDGERGGWFNVPAPFSTRGNDPKGDAYDPNYHALGACMEVLRSLGHEVI